MGTIKHLNSMVSFCNIELSFRPEQQVEGPYTLGGIVRSGPSNGNSYDTIGLY